MNDKITLTLEDGVTKEFDILFEYTQNDKKYVTYTDYEKDESGNIKCYSNILDGDKTLPVDEENLITIDKILRTLNKSNYILEELMEK